LIGGRIRKATFEAGMSRMQALTSRAVNTLEDLLEAKDHPTRTQARN
jgi:hypothetical protein